MKHVAIICLLAALVPFGSAIVEPSPGYLDFEFTDSNRNTVRLFWEPPSNTSSLDHYLVYQFTEDGTFPPQRIDAADNETTVSLMPDKAYMWYVTAVDSSGGESLPSNPVVLRGDYPHCQVFTYGLNPPDVIIQEGCLLPPPV